MKYGRRDELRRKFETLWRQVGGPALVAEYRFHPTRRWRFDYAVPTKKLAIELEGGEFVGGRHLRPVGFTNDCIKYNAAAGLGWRVFRLTTKMLDDAPHQYLTAIKLAIFEIDDP
jgi:very-short-patch-repair endonuclease